MARSLGPFDYIIIGAGSAGCLLANRLSADPKVQVLLLEAGGKDDYFWIHVPVGYLYTIANPRTDWCYRTDADPEIIDRKSTRLNSSHQIISYAVFCLKKKK